MNCQATSRPQNQNLHFSRRGPRFVCSSVWEALVEGSVEHFVVQSLSVSDSALYGAQRYANFPVLHYLHRRLLKLKSLSWWCYYPTISSSIIPFSLLPQSLPSSRVFSDQLSLHQVAKVEHLIPCFQPALLAPSEKSWTPSLSTMSFLTLH